METGVGTAAGATDIRGKEPFYRMAGFRKNG